MEPITHTYCTNLYINDIEHQVEVEYTTSCEDDYIGNNQFKERMTVEISHIYVLTTPLPDAIDLMSSAYDWLIKPDDISTLKDEILENIARQQEEDKAELRELWREAS